MEKDDTVRDAEIDLDTPPFTYRRLGRRTVSDILVKQASTLQFDDKLASGWLIVLAL